MRRFPRFPRTPAGAACLLALAVLWPAPALAQGEPPAAGDEMFGAKYVSLRTILRHYQDDRGLQPVAGDEESVRGLDPERTVLIYLGKPGELDQLNNLAPTKRWLENFVARGGAALIATDQNTGQALAGFGLHVDGSSVRKDQPRPGDTFTTAEAVWSDCPFVDFSPGVQTYPPVFKGLRKVATNRPSFLNFPPVRDRVGPEYQLGTLGWLPPGCVTYFPMPGANPLMNPLLGQRVVAVGGRWGKGRLLVLADHSIFIDSMMLPVRSTDDDNFKFTQNCLEWLTEAAPRKRDQLLFILDGESITELDAPDEPAAMAGTMDGEQFLAAANEFTQYAQENDLPNKLISRLVYQRTLFLLLAILLTLGLVVYGSRKLRAAGYHMDLSVPLLSSALGRLLPEGGPLAARNQAMLREQNLGDAARAVARQFFAGTVGEPALASPPGRVKVEGGSRPQVVHETVAGLWQLAYGSAPVRFTTAQFARLLVQLRALRAELKDGTVKLEREP